jgi:hypothetical protein
MRRHLVLYAILCLAAAAIALARVRTSAPKGEQAYQQDSVLEHSHANAEPAASSQVLGVHAGEVKEAALADGSLVMLSPASGTTFVKPKSTLDQTEIVRKHPDWRDREDWSRLANGDDKAAYSLAREALQDAASPAITRASALYFLSDGGPSRQIDEPSWQSAVSMLELTVDEFVRAEVCWGLKGLGASAVAQALMRRFRYDLSPIVREYALLSLETLDMDEALEQEWKVMLRHAALHDPIESIRATAHRKLHGSHE